MNERHSIWPGLNLAAAVLVHLLLGALWVLALLGAATFFLGEAAAYVWTLSALVLGVRALVLMSRTSASPARVWWLTFSWWLQTWLAPVALLLVALAWLSRPDSEPEPEPERRHAVDPDLPDRLQIFEGRLRSLERELIDLKLAAAAVAQPVPPTPVVPPPPQMPPAAVVRPPAPAPTPVRPPVAQPPAAAREPKPAREPRDWADLLGARALAIAGGLVTVLGIVFFFALAVNRGWVGPELRVGLGALASLLVFAGGLELRRRYEETYAALAAVGAGIAGAYATLLFAAARYDLVPDLAALVLAAAIAAVALATALAWSAELVAGFGLVGAMLVPFAVVLTGDVSAIGTAFVGFMLAAAGVVGLRRRWDWLLVAAAAASVPQLGVLVAQSGPGAPKALVLASAFSLVFAGIGLGRLRELDDRVDLLGGGFLALGGLLAAVSFQDLLGGSALGGALLAVAAAYAALSAWLLRRRSSQSVLAAVLAAAALPQTALLVVGADRGDVQMIALVAAFSILYATLGIVRNVARDADGLDPLGSGLVTGSAGLAAVSSLHLLGGTPRGIALLVLAAVYGVAAAVFFRGRRDLSSLLWAAALILAAGGGGELLSGLGLATVWAAQGAVLAWLAWRVRESRFQVAALGYLGLATVHALLLDAPLRTLFTATSDPASGAPALVAVAAGLVALALFARHDEASSTLALAGLSQSVVRRASLVVAAVFGTVAASLGLLDLAQRTTTFTWGEVAVTAFWAVLALAALAVGLRRGSRLVLACALAALAAPVVKAIVADATLGAPQQWYAILAAGAACAVGGFVYHLLERGLRTLDAIGVTLHVVGLAMVTPAAIELLGHDRLGLALGVLAAAYGVAAASVFGLERQRDHATLLWTASLVFAAAAAPALLDGTLLVLAWTAAAAALAPAARPLREPRFLIASAALVTLGLAETLARLAPPNHLTSAATHPGAGVVALVLTIGSTLLLLHSAALADELSRDDDRPDAYRALAASLLSIEPAARAPALWITGLLALYTVSLTLLELFERITPGTTAERFQHGHTAVSACWGVVALALLYAGLARRLGSLRLGGFVLFGAALAKLFLYDLAALSSIARALSFLAVGALLLVGGFFYQRLVVHERVAA